jgi:hypothetical protein
MIMSGNCPQLHAIGARRLTSRRESRKETAASASVRHGDKLSQQGMTENSKSFAASTNFFEVLSRI